MGLWEEGWKRMKGKLVVGKISSGFGNDGERYGAKKAVF